VIAPTQNLAAFTGALNVAQDLVPPAAGNGTADDTAAFQAALNKVGNAGGGVVFAPSVRGATRLRYKFVGHLSIPADVALVGDRVAPVTHTPAAGGIFPSPNRIATAGTCFLVTGGIGSANAAPFLTLHDCSALRGVLLTWPNQVQSVPPRAYPWAIDFAAGTSGCVENVELQNPYQGIRSTAGHYRTTIRGVRGQALFRGLHMAGDLDVARVEDVHWIPSWTINGSPLDVWTTANGEGFNFGRMDLLIAKGLFVLSHNVGFRFTGTGAPPAGSWAQLFGGGADMCNYGCIVNQCQDTYGIRWLGPSLTASRINQLYVADTNTGSVRVVGGLLGKGTQACVMVHGGAVSLSDCDLGDTGASPAVGVDVTAGDVIVQGCRFAATQPHVRLGPRTAKALVTGNRGAGGFALTNRMGNPADYAVANNL
jgi:hypothetical protein